MLSESSNIPTLAAICARAQKSYGSETSLLPFEAHTIESLNRLTDVCPSTTEISEIQQHVRKLGSMSATSVVRVQRVASGANALGAIGEERKLEFQVQSMDFEALRKLAIEKEGELDSLLASYVKKRPGAFPGIEDEVTKLGGTTDTASGVSGQGVSEAGISQAPSDAAGSGWGSADAGSVPK